MKIQMFTNTDIVHLKSSEIAVFKSYKALLVKIPFILLELWFINLSVSLWESVEWKKLYAQ